MIPDMPSTWFTADRLEQFWGYVKWFMTFNMPIFMICMACLVAYHVCDMIIESVQEAKKQQDKDDDDDIEIKHY